MKIFGKKRTPIESGSSQNEVDANDGDEYLTNHRQSSSSEEHIPSYFSPNFFDTYHNHSKSATSCSSNSVAKDRTIPHVKELMIRDPATLNSKERRILRRFHERQDVQTDPQSKVVDRDETLLGLDTDASKSTANEEISPPSDSSEQPSLDTKQLMQQLQGLNSKERRQLLRSWKQSQSSKSHLTGEIDTAMQRMKEEAKKIGVENREKIQPVQESSREDEQSKLQGENVEAHDLKKKNKRKRDLEERDGNVSTNKTQYMQSDYPNQGKSMKIIISKKGQASQEDDVNYNIPMTKSETTANITVLKKRKGKDWSLLTLEERQRRERQRQMQQEAQERRKSMLESGKFDSSLVPGKKYKHPLNSERRRANRRKPSGMVAKILAKRRD